MLTTAFAVAGGLFAARSTDLGRILGVGFALFGTVIGLLFLGDEIVGSQVIELDGSALKVCDTVLGIKRNRTFDITMMKYLRVGASAYWRGGTYVMSEGRIQFEYRNAMVSIGGNADEDEAFRIVEHIRSRIAPAKIQQ